MPTRLSLVCLLTVAVASGTTPVAAQTIDTRTGEVRAVVTIPNFGQTFTAPVGAQFLNSFTFFFKANRQALDLTPVTFQAYLRASNGTHAVGDVLFIDQRQVAPASGLPQETFLTGGIPVVAGMQYVVFLVPLDGSLTSALVSFDGDLVDSYAGGASTFMSEECATTANACQLLGSDTRDQAFIAEFSGGVQEVPEPSTPALLAFAIVVMLLASSGHARAGGPPRIGSDRSRLASSVPARPHQSGPTPMSHPAVRLIAAAAIVIITAVPAAAQTNSFLDGIPKNSSEIVLGSTTGATMSGMQVSWAFGGGGDGFANWGDLGGGLCGVAFGGLSVSMGCDADTFSADWTVSNFSAKALASLRFTGGALAHTYFDCQFTAGNCVSGGAGTALGSPGSGLGVSLMTVAGGSYAGGITGVYSNVVGIDGDAPVGDLSEQLTIGFDDLLGVQQTYVFNADTDNSISRLSPPTEVPEPSTCALMLAGIAGVGGLSRRRRRNE